MVDPISSDYLLKYAEQLRGGNETDSIGGLQDAGKTTAAGAAGGAEFKDMLTKMIGDVDQAQKQADVSLKQMAAGDQSTTIQDVVLKMEQADLSFKLMKEIRDKLVSAYKEVMSGQM